MNTARSGASSALKVDSSPSVECHPLQEDAVLSLEMAQRSDVDLVAASIDKLVALDAGTAAVQACLVLDGSLRQRYAKVSLATV